MGFLIGLLGIFFPLLPGTGLGVSELKAIGIAWLMISWWVAEVLPMAVVALIPLIAFPILGIEKMPEVAGYYANPIIFLFMGGFLIGLAIVKWDLHRRIALNIILLTGNSGNKLILGFILATGFLSMWLSNTATTMMMFPIAGSVIYVMQQGRHSEKSIYLFSLSLMLAIAYASNFGGMATLIGTPPNVALSAFILKKYNLQISFLDWMLVCLPLTVVLLAFLYLLLTRVLYPNKIAESPEALHLVKQDLSALGAISTPQKKVLIVFVGTAITWVLKEFFNMLLPFAIDDALIAIAGAIALFVLPADSNNWEVKHRLLHWDDARNLAWDILLMFGGGLALAGSLENAGIMEKLGSLMASYAGDNVFLLMLLIVAGSIFLSEVMSNVAFVIVLAPVIAQLCDVMGLNPLQMSIPMTLAASCSAMLPMGTPPNAIVFSSGLVPIKEMLKAGFILNLISTAIVTAFSWYVLPLVFN